MKKTINIFTTLIFLYLFTSIQVEGFSFSKQCSVASHHGMSGGCGACACGMNGKHDLDNLHHCSCNHHPQPDKTLDAIVESRISTSEVSWIGIVGFFTPEENFAEKFRLFTHKYGVLSSRIHQKYKSRQALTGCFLC